MSRPSLSVILPVYNAAEFLDEAVDSVRTQSRDDLELIAIDDGSTDASLAILGRHAAADRRVRVVARAHEGIEAALNAGLAQAAAPLVAVMNADDVARPDRLARQAALLEAEPGVAAVSGAMSWIDPAGREFRVSRPPTGPAEIRATLRRTNCMAHPAVMLRRDAALAQGGYRTGFAYAEDYDLWLRLAERWDLANLPEILLAYRVHPASMSPRKSRQQILSDLGARLAAERRAAGEPEPRPAVFDRDALIAAGLAPAAIDRALARRLMAAARLARRCGAAATARELVAEATLAARRQGLGARIDLLGRRLKARL
jgi:glycosyltransferase involved in cell wall biosynthesis